MKMMLMLLLALSLCSSSVRAGDQEVGRSITIGSGPKTVIEFTDPDCPYCRKAAKYFDGRSDVTRHVFFFPLPNHPNAKKKAQYVLSQMDRASAYHAVMSGEMDAVQKFEGITPQGVKLQEEQLEIAKRQKVDSTPTFMINGRVIVGFDLKKIKEALGN